MQVTYPGISPEDSERLLVKPLETYLRSIEGVKNITAFAYTRLGRPSSSNSTSTSTSRRRWKTCARRSIYARGEMPVLPVPPIVQEFNTALEPIVRWRSQATCLSARCCTWHASCATASRPFRACSTPIFRGNRDEMLEIVIDPAKLESYGITQQEMFNAVQHNNRLIAAGAVDTGHGSFAVKVPGVFETADDVLKLPIRSSANATVTLSDVADVRRTFYDPTTYARLNGQPTIALDVSKRIGANIIER